MGKKPVASVTYENERISIKHRLPYLKCVLRLSYVVHGWIYGRFMGLYVNGFLSPYITFTFHIETSLHQKVLFSGALHVLQLTSIN